MNRIVLKNLMKNREYVKKVLPYLKSRYFDGQDEKVLFRLIRDHIIKYKSLPKPSELEVELSNVPKISQKVLDDCQQSIQELNVEVVNETFDWLIDSTEKWIRQQALTKAILDSADLLSKNDQNKINGIPTLIQDALKIQFNSDVGIELMDEGDIMGRWEMYNRKIIKYECGVSTLDHHFDGGIEPKSVTILVAGTGVGKSMTKIAMMANMLRAGYDCLYVTLELSEEKVAQRFDANFLQIPINDIKNLDQQQYVKDLTQIKKKSIGRLMIKEFPPAMININHLRALLEELELKKNFKPQIIAIDYLNLMLSCRFSKENSYTTVKSIVEEIRGLAVEKEYAILTSTQGNRETNSTQTSDMDLTNISESIGTAQTADAIVALITPEELRNQNMQRWKILKNRFSGTVNKSFMVQVDYKTASVFDCDDQDFRLIDKVDAPKSKKNVKVIIDEEPENNLFVD